MKQSHLQIHIPDYARAALGALEAAGYESWCVGGCVRDALLGVDVNDYDIATAASWEDTEQTLKAQGFAVHRTGTKHGTVTASIDGHPLEITTFRADGTYTDGRHPDSVTFVRSIEEDLARRDFTINALACHPERGVLDCHGGLDDLEARTIRAVGDPSKRFAEDGLRILRGCRFASQLGFSIEPDTLSAMQSHKLRLANVSSERITHELDGLLLGGHVHDALMETANVLTAVIPEVAACIGFDQHTPYHIYDVWEHTAWVVQRSPATRLSRWAALLPDIGKPAAFFMDGKRAHFYGHPKLSVALSRGLLARMSVAPALSERILTLVRMHDVVIAADRRSVKRALQKLDGDVELFEALVALKKADALAQSDLSKPRLELAFDLERVLAEVTASAEAFTIGQLAIDGHDIMELGVGRGPEVGRLLKCALAAVIDEKVVNERGPLIEYVSKHLPSC